MARFTNLSLFPLLDCYQLLRSERIGSHTFFALVEQCGSPAEALAQLPDFARRGGGKRFQPFSRRQANKELEAYDKLGAKVIPYGHALYPDALATIPDAPALLIAKGDLSLLNKPTLGIVGSRSASAAGRAFARQIAQGFGQHGYVIASGLARGVDGDAHQGALPTGTIGVTAVGIDQIYPHQNKALYEAMFEQGCVVTEQPLGTKPQARLFPTRNRIIAGLSQGLVVIEASQRSGSLISARYALDYGREVAAMPGSPLDPRNHGSNQLIQEGAWLIQTAQDFLPHLPQAQFSMSEPTAPAKFSAPPKPIEIAEKDRQSLMETLSFTPVSVDELTKACHLSANQCLRILLELELAGRLQRLPGQRVALQEIA